MKVGVSGKFGRTATLWLAAVLLLLVMAAPALSTIFAPAGSVRTNALVKGAVASAKIKKGAVTSAKIKNGAVTSAKIKDGSITNADIAAGAVIAASKINMDGTVTVGVLAFKTPKTGKLSIPGTAFQPEDENYDFSKINYDLRAQTGGPQWHIAPVNLPDGAKVKYVGLQAYDDFGAGSLTVTLARWSTANSYDMMASIGTGADGASWQYTAITAAGIANPVIDNNYGYYLEAYFTNAGAANLRLGRVLIIYEYSSL